MGAKEPFWAAMDSRAAGTAPREGAPTEGVHPEDLQARGTSRAPPLRKDLSGSETRGLMLPLPDRPQIGQPPRTKRVGHNPHLRLLSHSGCNHGYARVGYELPQLLLQLSLQLFDGEPSGVNTV